MLLWPDQLFTLVNNIGFEADRVKHVGAACVLDAGNQIAAPRNYQDCATELEFVDWMPNFKKFIGSFLVLKTDFQHQERSQHPHALLYEAH